MDLEVYHNRIVLTPPHRLHPSRQAGAVAPWPPAFVHGAGAAPSGGRSNWVSTQLSMPPTRLPPSLLAEFTENLTLPVTIRHHYRNEASDLRGRRLVRNTEWRLQELRSHFRRAEGGVPSLQHTALDARLFDVLARNRHLLARRHVAVVGSDTSWLACVALAFGARRVTVLSRFNHSVEIGSLDKGRTVTSNPDTLQVVPLIDFDSPESPHPRNHVFDVAISTEMMEHLGMGWYLEPLNGRADLEMMHRIRQMVVPGGFLLLAIPMGEETIVWNTHRMYGKDRWAKLHAGWAVYDSAGWSESTWEQPYNVHHKPAILLRSLLAVTDAGPQHTPATSIVEQLPVRTVVHRPNNITSSAFIRSDQNSSIVLPSSAIIKSVFSVNKTDSLGHAAAEPAFDHPIQLHPSFFQGLLAPETN
jgi:hypothetical protein